VIRFSAFLVVVAVGLLVAGVVTSKLWLVYIAIGVSGVALLALGLGAAVNWRELTGKTAETSAQGPAAQAAAPEVQLSEAQPSHAQPSQVPVPAGSAPAGSGWPARPATAPSSPSAPSGLSRSGYLPATESPRPRPEPRPGAQPPGSRPDDVPRAPAAFTPRREPPAASVWEFRDNTIQVPPAAEAPAQSAAPPTSPQPVVKPVPPRDEDIAEPSPTAGQDQPPAKEKPEPAPEAEPAPDADPASEPELTLVPGATVAAGAAASAPATSQAERPEQDKQAAEAEAESAGPDPTMEVTVAPGVPRYHNAHCTLIRFMGDSDLDKMTLAAAREVGCTPCRACLPDQPEGSPE
jgi:hypothetical protein